jgi:hypothetical protein
MLHHANESKSEGMSDRIVVSLNGESMVEYDRRKPLSEKQREFLDRMDEDMDSGITLDGERIEQPQPGDRARFVAMNLAEAVLTDNEARAAATTSFLADRLPDLKQVRIVRQDDDVSIDLVFDQEFVRAQPIHFVSPRRDS